MITHLYKSSLWINVVLLGLFVQCDFRNQIDNVGYITSQVNNLNIGSSTIKPITDEMISIAKEQNFNFLAETLAAIQQGEKIDIHKQNTEKFNNTPLHEAVELGNYIKIPVSIPKDSHLVYENYTIRNQIDIIQALLDRGADVNILNEEQRSPLYYFSHKSFKKEVSFLNTYKELVRKASKETINLKNKDSSFPYGPSADESVFLFEVVKKASPEEIDIVLSHPGIDINIKNEYGYPILHAVAADEDIVVQGTLVHKGVKNNTELLHKLINKGANVEATDREGLTLLNFAVKYSKLSIIRFIFSLNKGIDVNTADNAGNTPLHHAVMNTYYGNYNYTNYHVATFLLVKGAHGGMKNVEGLGVVVKKIVRKNPPEKDKITYTFSLVHETVKRIGDMKIT